MWTLKKRTAISENEILPKTMAGKSLLDLYCGRGGLCLEAARRNASRVLGYGASANEIAYACKLVEKEKLKVELILGEAASRVPEQVFDLISCNLEGLRSPFELIDRLVPFARDRLIIRAPVARGVLSWLPVMMGVHGSNGTGFKYARRALELVLQKHRKSFSRLHFVRSAGEIMVVGHKYRFSHLVVVSGPVSAGKTTFCERLRNGSFPEIAATLGIRSGERPPIMGTSLNALPVDSSERTVLFHYGFLRPYLRKATVNERDEVLDVLNAAARLTFATIWAPPEELVARITQSEIAGRQPSRSTPRYLQLREEYKNTQRLIDHYEEWLSFCQRFVAEHFFVAEVGGKTELISIDEWRRMRPTLHRNYCVSVPLPQNRSDASEIADIIFPRSLAGKSVLDVNCDAGQLCLEAIRRGASQVVGFDVDRDRIDCAQSSVASHETKVRFELRNFDAAPTREKFDYVVCIDELNDIRDPWQRIHQLACLAKEVLVVDFAGVSSHEGRKRLKLPAFVAEAVESTGLIFVCRNGAASSHGSKFVMTKSAVQTVLLRHCDGFSRLTFRKRVKTGRHIAIAERLAS